MIALAVAFLLQAFAASSMPVSVSMDDDVIVICTGTGVKAVALSDLGVEVGDLDQQTPDITISGELCALCSFAHNIAIMPSASYAPAMVLGAHTPQAPPFQESVPNGYLSVHQARAPPSNA